jgi:hypothetical protein
LSVYASPFVDENIPGTQLTVLSTCLEEMLNIQVGL